MPWHFNVEFGGLCMFVVRTGLDGWDPGLFVLVPATPPDMEHFPTLLVRGAGRGQMRASMSGVRCDFRNLPATGKTARLPPEVARVSSFVGDRPVAEEWLTDPTPSGTLAARFVFPLPSQVTIDSRFKTPRMHPRDNPTNVQPYAGRALVSVLVPDDTIQEIEVGGVTLFRLKKHSSLDVKIVNVMKEDLDCPRQKKHSAGGFSHHFATYYGLLKDQPRGPDLVFDDQQPTEDPDCQDPFDESFVFVDPFNCTIGSGCPQEQPSC